MLKTLDPKLVYAVLSAIAARVLLEFGLTEDETVQAVLPLALAALVGYLVPNDGTVLRTAQENGSAYPPHTGKANL